MHREKFAGAILDFVSEDRANSVSSEQAARSSVPVLPPDHPFYSQGPMVFFTNRPAKRTSGTSQGEGKPQKTQQPSSPLYDSLVEALMTEHGMPEERARAWVDLF